LLVKTQGVTQMKTCDLKDWQFQKLYLSVLWFQKLSW